MRLYSDAEERQVRLQANVREWTRSGLLEPVQGRQLEADIVVQLRRTGSMLRVGQALFTFIVVGAAVALVATVLHITSQTGAGALTGFFALVCLAAADVLVRGVRLYRHGVEEALAVGGAGLLGVSVGVFVGTSGSSHFALSFALALLAGAAAAFFVYRRFGFDYAAVGATVCVALVPFQFEVSRPFEHLLAAATFAAAFWLARRMHLRHGDEYPGDEGTNLQAMAFLGIYFSLNVWFQALSIEPWFRWTSYAATWVLPALALVHGLRKKDRQLLDAGLATSIVTLLTSKSYLGWPRHPWDPMLLGLLLAGVALVVRRWLAAGPNGERGGFTPVRVLAKDADAIRLVGIASAGIHRPAVAPPAPDAGGFGGGRSGGGGTGADY